MPSQTRSFMRRWAPSAVRASVRRWRSKTNPISHAVLSDLAEGQGPEPLHDLLEAMVTGQESRHLESSAARLARVGNTSGWDMLAGAVTGMLLLTTSRCTERIRRGD